MLVYLDVSCFYFFALNWLLGSFVTKEQIWIAQDIFEFVCTGSSSAKCNLVQNGVLFENDSGTVYLREIGDLFICALKRHHCRLYF